MNLKNKKCIPCEDKKMKPMKRGETLSYTKQVSGWKLDKLAKKISKTFLFDDFKKALKFVNTVGKIAETESHHPDISVHYNRVILDIWTHSIGGLSENDFIVAAKIDAIK